ncbi:hypothetical protein BLNAU_18364 [Blattamonas nauphoetae]|uniref:Protein kinase domain-containing protein n=1 Tax=Blattamonas nauphoetae TaxID=2049346 RepID=A0ABQ9X6Z9_9EUKA|nr:hypothetical protein BLNAU_18364 [Blattamonas nauphoetae]
MSHPFEMPADVTGTDQATCTFQACTFSDISSESDGSAVSISTPIHLCVANTHFRSCCTTGSSSVGGAISMTSEDKTGLQFTCQDSSFRLCSSKGSAGTLFLDSVSTVSFTRNFFFESSATVSGGAIFARNLQNYFTFHNSTFSTCTAINEVGTGGAFFVDTSPWIFMNYLIFTENSAAKAQDIYFRESGGIGSFSNLIIESTTTTFANTVVVSNSDVEEDGLGMLRATPQQAMMTSLEIVMSNTIRTSLSLPSVMNLFCLVDNTGYYEPPNEDSPPPMQRLLMLGRPNANSQFTQSVAFGEWELLQQGSTYKLVAASCSSGQVMFQPTVSFTTPNQARIVQAIFRYDSEEQQGYLRIKGRNINKPTTYILTISIGDQFEEEVSFGISEEGSLNILSFETAVDIGGENSRYKWDTTYMVKSALLKNGQTLLVMDPPAISFTTPSEPKPTLKSIATSYDHQRVEMLTITLSGTFIPAGQYTITVRAGIDEPINITTKFEQADSGTASVALYDKDSTQTVLKPNTQYIIENFYQYGSNIPLTILGPLSFTTPQQPPRVISVSTQLTKKDEVTVTLTGTEFDNKALKMTVQEGNEEEITSPTLISYENGVATVTFKVSQSANPITGTLAFGVTYAVKDVKDDTAFFVVNTGVAVEVPNPPRLTSVGTPSLTGTLKDSVTIPLIGAMIPEGDYTLAVKTGNSQKEIAASFKQDETGSASAVVYSLDEAKIELVSDASYSIVSLVNKDAPLVDVTIFGPLSFTTPQQPPRVISVSTQLTKKDEVTVTLTGTEFDNKALKMTVQEGNEEEITSPTLISYENGVATVTFKVSQSANPITGTLAFGVTYAVKDVKDDTAFFVVNTGVAVEVPNPPRLTSVGTPSLTGTLKDSVTIPLIGAMIPEGDYTLAVKTGNSQKEIAASFKQDETGSASAVVYSLDEAKIELVSDASYSIVSLVNKDAPLVDVTIFGPLSFTTPQQPPRVISVSTQLTKKDEVTVTLTGTEFDNKALKMTVQEGNEEEITSPTLISYENGVATVTFKVSQSANPITGTLAFGVTYAVKDVKDDTAFFVVNTGVAVEVPNPPRLTSVGTPSLTGTLKDSVTIPLIGAMIPEGDYTLAVKTGNSQKEIAASFKQDETGSASAVVYSLDEAKIELVSDASYSIVSLVNKDAPLVDVTIFGPLSFTTPQQPPRVISVTPTLTAADQMKLTFSGKAFENKALKVRVQNGEGTTVVSPEAISYVGETSVTVNFHVAVTDDPQNGQLAFEGTYTVRSVDNGTDAFVVNTGVAVEVPNPPRLTSVGTPSLTGTLKDVVTIPLIGAMIPEGDYTLAVKTGNSQKEIAASFKQDGTGSASAVVYSLDEAKIELVSDASYSIVSLVNKDAPLVDVTIFGPLSFTTPSSIARISTITNLAHISVDNTTATITLTGTVTENGQHNVTVKRGDMSFTQTADTVSGTTSFTVAFGIGATEDETTGTLKFGGIYTLDSISQNGQSKFLIYPDLSFLVPSISSVTGAEVKPGYSRISFQLSLLGTSLDRNAQYTITLTPQATLTVFFNHATNVTSATIPLVGPNALLHGTSYTITSITKSSEPFDSITPPPEPFTTPSKPTEVTLFVDKNKGSIDLPCGDVERPCASIDVAWTVIAILTPKQTTLSIVHSALQNTSLLIENEKSVQISTSDLTHPVITIPADASIASHGAMVVVSNGVFVLNKVRLQINPAALSFVYLSGDGAEIEIVDVSYVGEDSTLSNNDDADIDELCEWTTGIIQLVNCETTITNSILNYLPQGAINMINGTLSITSSIFLGNSPRHSLFPSSRRNIHCLEEGDITVGGRTSGDGSSEHPSAWIFSNQCRLHGDDANQAAPLFVPTLSKNESSSVYDKKGRTFELKIVGETLFPCGLVLEVFEEQKGKETIQSERINLTLETTASFTDKIITLTINKSDLSELNEKVQWNARLMYGAEHRTDTVFVFQLSSSDRLAEAVRENMKWWIPLVVCLLSAFLAAVIIIVVCVRRRNRKNLTKTELNDVGEEMVVEKLEVEQGQGTVLGSSMITARDDQQTEHDMGEFGKDTFNLPDDEETQVIPIQYRTEAILCEGRFNVEVVNKTNTLYNRLHVEKQLIDRIGTRMKVAMGVKQLIGLGQLTEILPSLTSHWFIYDQKGRITLRLAESETELTNQQVPPDDQKKEEKADLRWQTPEQKLAGADQKGFDVNKAAVFRLGLILYEIETGTIPFGEQDAVNANRSLCSGMLPNMDGVSEEMKTLIEQCLTIDPDNRPTVTSVITSLSQIKEDTQPKKQFDSNRT